MPGNIAASMSLLPVPNLCPLTFFRFLSRWNPSVILPIERRLEYDETLDKAHVEGIYPPFFSLIYEMSSLSHVGWAKSFSCPPLF